MILLILAAGMGSRYGGMKQVDGFGPNGETIMDYALYDAIRTGFQKVVFVIQREMEGFMRERFATHLTGKIAYTFAYQRVSTGRQKPWGTAHAVLCAASELDAPFAVINADDFYGLPAFETMANFLATSTLESEFAMIGYQLKNTLSQHGSVARGICVANEKGYLTEIVERTKIFSKGNEIVCEEKGKELPLSPDSLVSMNFWGLKSPFIEYGEPLFWQFSKDNADKPKAEFFIPLVIDYLMKVYAIKVKVLSNTSTWFGVTYAEDKAWVQSALQQKIEA
ncbi:MAG: sugar phosphate nucleotidyltransferase, partial [Bacteroidia bacterium]